MTIKEDFISIIESITCVLSKPIQQSKYLIIDRGTPHVPGSLPPGKMGIYTFLFKGEFLKIGKAGPKSNARFISQHYNPKSAQSTLAASILVDKNMAQLNINESNVGNWIKKNTQRIDIILDEDLGIFTLELIEAALHYKYEPRYEGFQTQR